MNDGTCCCYVYELGLELRSIGPSMFEGEALGLRLMYETKTILVPRPFKMRNFQFNLLAYQQLANIRFLIIIVSGITVKNNRLGLYLEVALTLSLSLSSLEHREATRPFSYWLWLGQRLAKNLKPLFENVVIEPCLLHGDLWSGNVSADESGDPVILDPACYYGHSEAEFGMSWCACFGGSFYKAYFEMMPGLIHVVPLPESLQSLRLQLSFILHVYNRELFADVEDLESYQSSEDILDTIRIALDIYNLLENDDAQYLHLCGLSKPVQATERARVFLSTLLLHQNFVIHHVPQSQLCLVFIL
ncbi:Protein-ribulosamine 3-kinase, chloroplastic-like protein [Drosera capensis]